MKHVVTLQLYTVETKVCHRKNEMSLKPRNQVIVVKLVASPYVKSLFPKTGHWIHCCYKNIDQCSFTTTPTS